MILAKVKTNFSKAAYQNSPQSSWKDVLAGITVCIYDHIRKKWGQHTSVTSTKRTQETAVMKYIHTLAFLISSIPPM